LKDIRASSLPLAPKQLTRLFPELWDTQKAAERWLAKNPPEAIRDIIRVWGVLNGYRPKGQTNWSKALVRHGAGAREAITAVLEVPAGGHSGPRPPPIEHPLPASHLRQSQAMARRNARDCSIHPHSSLRLHTGRTNPRAHPRLRSKDLPNPGMDLGRRNTGLARNAAEPIRPSIGSNDRAPGANPGRSHPPPVRCRARRPS
jgi:hypothetical protein